MMRLIAVVSFLLINACTHHQARVNYRDFGIYSSDNVGNKTFQDVGPVSGSKYSWVWTGCDELAIDAIKNMLDEAKAMGANTVYNVRFSRNGVPTTVPTCERQWGWLMVMVPFPAKAFVTGTAATVEEGLKTSKAIRISPDEDPKTTAMRWLSAVQGKN